MPRSESSDLETRDEGLDSGSEPEEPETEAAIPRTGNISEYEKQRIRRIEENRARMEALGLHKMAKSLMGSLQKAQNKSDNKGKRKVADEDEDYTPGGDDDEEDELGSSSEEEKEKLKRTKKQTLTPKKSFSKQKPAGISDFLDDDDALMKAIALSLQDSTGFLDVTHSALSQSSGDGLKDHIVIKERKLNSEIQEDKGKRKRKKMNTNRVQMTEDELIIHFFQFDEAGKGSISLRDLRRLAAEHDFIWSDEEIADMIRCFDTDADGKLSLEDFRKIVGRCNMIKSS